MKPQLFLCRYTLSSASNQWRAEVWSSPGRLLDWMPSNKFWYWVMAHGGHCDLYTLYVTSQYDVIFTFASQRFDEACWHNMHIQERRNSGRAGGVVTELRAMETYKKQKNRSQSVCFCSSTMLTSKIITEIIENHSEFAGFRNSWNKFVSSLSW